MRRCPGCEEVVPHDDVVCMICGYRDAGWKETLGVPRMQLRQLSLLQTPATRLKEAARQIVAPPLFVYSIPVNSFSDGSQLAHDISLAEAAHAAYAKKNGRIASGSVIAMTESQPILRFDYRPCQYDWNASVYEDFSGEVMPAIVGVHSLVEARRAIQFARAKHKDFIIEAVLPARSHPLRRFLEQGNFVPDFAVASGHSTGQIQDEDDSPLRTLLPLYSVDPSLCGELPDQVFDQITDLAVVAGIEPTYTHYLRTAIGELAVNGYVHGGGGCTVGAFMRDESAVRGGYGLRIPLTAGDDRRIHLFVHYFTTGPTFAQKLGLSSEEEAVAKVFAGQHELALGGGLGLGGSLARARDYATGTTYVNSGNYTRVDMPNGIVREWTAEAGMPLPGIHICLLVPLAHVSRLTRQRTG